jgi:signal transduction histidine kinase
MRFNEIVPVEIERLTRITGDLLTFARPSPPSLMPTDINGLLERVVTLLGNQLRKKQIAVVPEFGEVVTIQADGQQLTQVFMNLILNAIQASRESGRLWLTTAIKGRAGEPEGLQQVIVEIRDEGTGIKHKDMSSVFEPFFTTKHEGTGLGLATSRRIVESHYGQIFVTSQEGQGATFTVSLPIIQPGSEHVATIG